MKLLSPAALLVALLATACIQMPAEKQDVVGERSKDFVEEHSFFRVTIGGRTVRLEGMTVKRADATGRLPIALITHGKAPNLQSMLDQHATAFIGQAKDLANRGWLAVVVIRRGFGQSDGPMPAPMSCQSTSFVERFAADADDLQATLDFIAKRPDADPTRMIAIGGSTGGAAVVALSARNPQSLRGVISISGGMRMESCPKEDLLAQAYQELGTKSRVPGLWMYAKNDSLFGPDVVGRMRDGFLDAGGDVKLVMFDPIGQDGHTLFSLAAGRNRWLPQMDAFLRFHQLPTWRRDDVNLLIKRLNAAERDRGFVEGFVAAPLDKALARVSGSAHLYGAWGAKTIGDARNSTLTACQKQRPKDKKDNCVIVMENDHWVGGTP